MKMEKKILFFIIFAVFFLKNTEGQTRFMLFAGFNSSKIVAEFDNKETIVSEAKSYYNFGGGFRFEFARVLFLQPEIYFTRKGGLEKAFRTGDSLDEEINIPSVDMPIMLGLRLGKDKLAMRVYGGPVVSFLNEDNASSITVLQNGKYLTTNDINQYLRIFSVQAGVGIDFLRFTFDVRYEYAFSPILSINEIETKHKIIYFTLGIKIF